MLGAGMMGAAIAYVCAKAGIEVVLKDVSQDAADKGKAYSQTLVEKAIAKGRSTQEKGDALLARITPTDDASKAQDADLVIEAVFEDPAVKAQVFAEIEPHLAEGALLGSNTSTLPITGLAEGVSRPADFIGLHFFSPVDKMPLLEIIKGEQTSEETLYRALDVAKQIKKTPIVVNDSRGFFTSRVIGTFINEGIAMLTEGVPAPSIEQASSQAGYPAPVLQLSDELNMELMVKVRKATLEALEAEGSTIPTEHPSFAVIDTMIEAGRPGRLRGAGFYEYEDGKRTGLWPGLKDAFGGQNTDIPFEDLKERMLVRRGARDRQVPRRGRHRDGRRRQHRVDHGHRLPGLDRRCPAVHQRLRGRPRRLRRPRPRAGRELRRALRAAGVAGREGRARRGVLGRRGCRRGVDAAPAGRPFNAPPAATL